MSEVPDVIQHVTNLLREHEHSLQSIMEDWKKHNSETMICLHTMLETCMQGLRANSTSLAHHTKEFEMVVPNERKRVEGATTSTLQSQASANEPQDIGHQNEQHGSTFDANMYATAGTWAGLRIADDEAPIQLKTQFPSESGFVEDDGSSSKIEGLPRTDHMAVADTEPETAATVGGISVIEPTNDGSMSRQRSPSDTDSPSQASRFPPRTASRQNLIENAGMHAITQLKLTATGKLLVDDSQDDSPKHRGNLRHTGRFNLRARFAGEIDYFMQRLESVVGVFIIANAIYLGWLTEARASHNVPSEQATSSLARAFAVVFLFDLVLRILLQGVEFFLGPDRVLNNFDVIVVLSTCVDVLGLDQIPQVSILRAVRVFRLLRVIRAVRVFSVFYEFRLLIWSMVEALRAFFWVACLVSLMLYTASLGLVDACLYYCNALSDDEPACKYFGNMGSSMLTLYEAMLGGLLWGELLEILSPLDFVTKAIFVFFVSIAILLCLNVYVAVIFDVVQRKMKQDREMTINDDMLQRELFITSMRELFRKVDANDSGAISLDELQIAVGDPRIAAFMSVLGLRVIDLESLFEILDVDGSLTIDKEEFLLGCQRLRGEARTVDMVSLQNEVGVLLHYVRQIRQQIMPDAPTDDLKPLSRSLAKKRGATASHRLRVSGGKDASATIIKKSEERAMLLSELRQVCKTINLRCEAEAWTNRAKLVEPENVDLYQFNYHVICPETVPDGIMLHGLSRAHYAVGDKITQADHAYVRAEGVIAEASDNGDVRVTVKKGRFISNEYGRSREISVNGVERGVPTNVIATGCISYKELIATAPQKPRWYCSHWWGERIFEFVLCCEEHAFRRRMRPNEASYWICGYANRQYDLTEDVCADIESTAFFKAIGVSEGVLLVLDEHATPFQRIWCDFEIYQTLSADSRKKLDIVTVAPQEDSRAATPLMISDGPLPKENARDKTIRESSFPLSVFAKGMKAKLENGESSVELDRTNIMNFITKGSKDPEALQRANYALNSFFARAAWPQAVKHNIVQDFDTSQPGQLCLPKVLARDVEVKSCILSLEHMEEVSDLEMIALSEGMPPNLLELILSFEGCFNISNMGLQALGTRLPETLQVLKLDFLACHGITNTGIATLAKSLPGNLQVLHLHFDNCEEVGLEGVRALAESVPRGVIFKGTFKGTGVDRDFDSLAELKRAGAPSRLSRR